MARPIAKDHDAKRQHILKTAARVFAQEGIARASMNRVAEACGISKANIYHYYASKDDLLFDILDTYLSALTDRVLGVRGGGTSPEDELRRLLTEYLLAYDGMDNEHKIQTEGLPLLPEELQRTLKDYQKAMVLQMSEILDAVSAQQLGQDPKLLRETTMSVFGMLNWYYMWHPKANDEDRFGYADMITRFTVAGIPGVLA